MATKRKRNEFDDAENNVKKHTLDSDEEDSDDYEKDELNNGDIDGEEDGEATVQDEVKITPFNMREELEEGHFDKDGHYHWNKDSEIKDNWLDNIDWVKVKSDKNYFDPNKKGEDDEAAPTVFNELQSYAMIFGYMEPNETVQETLQRLGKSRTKISTAERLRRKKMGIVDDAGEKIIKFTELTNEILTRTGNMDIYQESYRDIKMKIVNLPTTSQKATGTNNVSDSCDMYADNFEETEKRRLESRKDEENAVEELQKRSGPLMWEFKWKQEEEKVEGPYTTEQMHQWSLEKHFKEVGAYVRKVGDANTNFYSSKRIDFDLYM